MDSSEEESGLLHQVKERLSKSTNRSWFLLMLCKKRVTNILLIKSFQKFLKGTFQQSFTPHSVKNFPRKGAQR